MSETINPVNASTAPQNASLPLLYTDLIPVSSIEHASWKTRAIDNVLFLRTQHAIPVTIDEFALVQRNYPIIFSVGDNPVPLALMGLNEGVNTFVEVGQGSVLAGLVKRIEADVSTLPLGNPQDFAVL